MHFLSTTTSTAIPLGLLPELVLSCIASCLTKSPIRAHRYAKYQTTFRRQLSTERASLNRTTPGDFSKGATWLSPNPSKVRPEDVLAMLPKLDAGKYKGLKSIVILVTPSFAQWLEKDNPFLEQAVERLCGGGITGSKRTFSSVVDRIPGRTPDKGKPNRAHNLNIGSEGISILLTSSKISFINRQSSVNADADVQANVRFVTSNIEYENSIILPSANTMFLNGARSTMFCDKFSVYVDKISGGTYIRSHRDPLEGFDIALNSTPEKVESFLKKEHHLLIDAPLLGLTKPREIVSSMGNVIRELKEEEAGKVFPASTELEAAVPRFLETYNSEIPRANIRVFASVLPKQAYDIAPQHIRRQMKNSEADKIISSGMVKAAFYSPARWYRVTGGGGGWGKKKGLLSLDPATDFTTKESGATALPDSDLDADFGKTSDLVSPGNMVQFYTTVIGTLILGLTDDVEKSKCEEITSTTKHDGDIWEPTQIPRIVLGTNPSQEDYAPPRPTQTGSEEKLVLVPDHFGMFSEGGACIGFDYPSIEAATISGNPVAFRSRFDVPYTTFLGRKRGMKPQPNRLAAAHDKHAAKRPRSSVPGHRFSMAGRKWKGKTKTGSGSHASGGVGDDQPVNIIKYSLPPRDRPRLVLSNKPHGERKSD